MTRALVTGGTRGIGAATAMLLRDRGHDVFVTGTRIDGKGPAGCHYLACNFADVAAVERFTETVRQLDFAVLVNNAGINKIGPVAEYDPVDFARIQQVNVSAPFSLCRAVIPGMRRARFGRIVNITSIFAVVSRPGRAAYSASKSALAGLTRGLALEVASDNVLVNCLAPGVIDTELTRRVLGEAGVKELIEQVPMGRLAGPEEIARYVVFLASEENSFMTGQTLVVDGGFTAA